MLPTTADIVRALARIEGKVDTLLLVTDTLQAEFATLVQSLADDEEPDPTTLDGTPLPERDQTQGLG